MLEAKNITVTYGNFKAVDGLSFSVESGQWLMLIGPNGAGKSTALGAVAQSVPYTGSVTYRGRDLHKMKPCERASQIGILAQNHFVGYGFTVEEVVRLGLYSRSRNFFSSRRPGGEQTVEEALALTGLTAQRYQSVLTLSGGELQRTFLAQVLAQNPKVLLLDEPANHLDLLYQKQVFSLIQKWLREPDRAVISVVHDLSLAKVYGTHAILLNHGKCAASGTVQEVMTPEKLYAAYGMDVGEWMRQLLSVWEVPEKKGHTGEFNG